MKFIAKSLFLSLIIVSSMQLFGQTQITPQSKDGNKQETTALLSIIEACRDNDLASLKTVLTKSKDEFNIVSQGTTPLLLAINNQNTDMVKYLISKGADVNLAVDEISPMSLADQGNYTGEQSAASREILDVLIASALKSVKNAPNSNEIRNCMTKAIHSIYNTDWGVALRLFQVLPDSTYNGGIAINCDAALYNSNCMYEVSTAPGKMKVPKDCTADTHVFIADAFSRRYQMRKLNSSGWCVVTVNAVYNFIEDELDKVIRENGNPNLELSNHQKPIVVVAILNDQDKMNKLLEMGVSINSPEGKLALAQSCSQGSLTMVNFLALKGADLNAIVDSSSYLHFAAEHGHLKVVEFLLKKGLNAQQTDKGGETPIMLASRWGHLDVVKLLLENGCAINNVDNDGQTALSVASSHGWNEVIKALVIKGAALNNTDKLGNTALHDACYYGYVDVTSTLLKAGANRTIKNLNGKTAYDMAKDKGNGKVMALFTDLKK